MTTTDLERVTGDAPIALFAGATPGELIAAATDVANRFSDIVKQRRMFKRIGDRDHIQIEAWQTVGSLTGVFATEAGGVRELPWPNIEPVGAEPPPAGPEPDKNRKRNEWDEWKVADDRHKAWEHHGALLDARAIGRAFGFVAAFRAMKDGREIGWGEGRVDRTERTWVSRDDYALASMTQTRGQGRTYGAPLRFLVTLAGYDPTPPDEVDGTAATAPAADGAYGDAMVKLNERIAELEAALAATDAGERIQFAPDDSLTAAAAAAEQLIAFTTPPGVEFDGHRLVATLIRAFKYDDGLPETIARALRIFAWTLSDPRAQQQVFRADAPEPAAEEEGAPA